MFVCVYVEKTPRDVKKSKISQGQGYVEQDPEAMLKDHGGSTRPFKVEGRGEQGQQAVAAVAVAAAAATVTVAKYTS